MKHLDSLRYIDAIARAGSIRKAAETLAITSTALNRRLLAMEEELGVPIFERLPRGVRLSTAGELLIHHIRNQISDLDRVRSHIADLSGERRGHISIACSQALLPFFLPEQISLYRRDHPAVTFSVHLRDRDAAEQALVDHSADIALVLEPVRFSDFHTLTAVQQTICAVMAADHPLAKKEIVRLRDCVPYPIGLPTASYGVRHLIDAAMTRASFRLPATVESDSFEFLRRYPTTENLISFQIPIGLPPQGQDGLQYRPLDLRDAAPGQLLLGQLRGRSLPVAAAKFADQIARAMTERYS
ncbi:LysR family transcriptional regulator [Tabrizicola sp. J26]|uniref:LysR family transcriptional regulator n=1 Tax=Alitabrizicola rongguiensis TaxID=2909234 RepID=UPI001F40D4BF|nr:LysR family transcriptional regulator [Tabrizicola rongguiensis]MCF1707532.1 LysR family transcriptional regulator [Tabrizicola rongguiensis]